MYACMHVRMHVRMYVCMYACMYVCMHLNIGAADSDHLAVLALHDSIPALVSAELRSVQGVQVSEEACVSAQCRANETYCTGAKERDPRTGKRGA